VGISSHLEKSRIWESVPRDVRHRGRNLFHKDGRGKERVIIPIEGTKEFEVGMSPTGARG
jgi:hypothetical protein